MPLSSPTCKLATALSLGLLALQPAMANVLDWQGVSFETVALDADTLQLTITGATSASGNWAGVNYLNAFEIKDVGNVTGASIVSGPGAWVSFLDNGLSANLTSGVGCTTGGTPGACFDSTPAAALSNTMTWVIDFKGTNLDFSAPHLKVQFLTSLTDRKATGDLLSQAIPAVPEPSTYALMLAGLAAVGFMAGRRRRS